MPQQHHQLIIDSRDGLALGGTVNDFFLNFRPGLQNVRSVRLLYADLPSPSSGSEPYFLIRTSLGSHVRGALEGDSASFVIPRTAAAGFRTFHSQNSQFPAIVFEEPSTSLSSIAVSVAVRGGGSANLPAHWYMLLEVCTD